MPKNTFVDVFLFCGFLVREKINLFWIENYLKVDLRPRTPSSTTDQIQENEWIIEAFQSQKFEIIAKFTALNT